MLRTVRSILPPAHPMTGGWAFNRRHECHYADRLLASSYNVRDLVVLCFTLSSNMAATRPPRPTAFVLRAELTGHPTASTGWWAFA
jgi:hypothetical protein